MFITSKKTERKKTVVKWTLLLEVGVEIYVAFIDSKIYCLLFVYCCCLSNLLIKIHYIYIVTDIKQCRGQIQWIHTGFVAI